MIEFKAKDPHYDESRLGKWWRETFQESKSTSASSSLGSECVGECILPASHCSDKMPTYNSDQADWVDIESVQITTHDKVILDGLQVAPASLQDLPIQDRKYIINFHSNGDDLADSQTACIEKAQKLQCIVIDFNYRGVTEETQKAKKYQDLVVDGIAQVQRLIAEGVDPENITLDGFSLGGAIATLVALHCHQNHQRVSVFNDRSFGTLAKEIAHLVIDEVPLFSGILEASVAPVLSLASWAIKAAVAYRKIPVAYRGHMFIGPKDAVNPGDGVIMDDATLHAEIPAHDHGLCWQMNAEPRSQTIGHCQSRSELRSAEGFTGDDVFQTFINRPRQL